MTRTSRNAQPPTRTLPAVAALLVVCAVASPAAAVSPPSLSAACGAEVDGQCYTAGAFELTASSPEATRFKICRSVDTTGWGGCDVVVSKTVSAVDGVGTLTIDGDHLPSDGFRRAYYASACDASNVCTRWKHSQVVYVSRDASWPDLQSASTAAAWVVDDGSVQEIVATAADDGSGIAEIRVQVNLQGDNAGEPRGLFSWNESFYRWSWSDDLAECEGGGFASKHPKDARPTTVTLVGCRTSANGGTRTVTFEVRPNPTFGVAELAHDVSLRAFDRLDHRTGWQNFDLDFSSLRSWIHRADGIGYQGILDGAGLQEASDAGIGVDVATLLYQRKECAPYYWRTVDTEGIVGAYQAQNVKAMVILENFLFRDVNDPEGDDCEPLEPPPKLQPSPCFNNAKWRLVADWRERLAEFVTLHGEHLTSATVALMLVSSEVNDRCFDLAEVEEVAEEVRIWFPDLPVAMIYGATHGADGERKSQPPPASFPPVFDIVGLFSYNLYDVTNPLEPRNATASFYDPEDPENPATIYGDLLGKLQPEQQVLLVFEANMGGPKSDLGWLPEDLGEVALNYADFNSQRPEITILGGFTWQGLLSLPQSVLDVHAEMVCRDVINDSPVCGASP